MKLTDFRSFCKPSQSYNVFCYFFIYIMSCLISFTYLAFSTQTIIPVSLEIQTLKMFPKCVHALGLFVDHLISLRTKILVHTKKNSKGNFMYFHRLLFHYFVRNIEVVLGQIPLDLFYCLQETNLKAYIRLVHFMWTI